MSIIREWRGRTTVESQEAYPAHFARHVKPALKAQPGFINASLARRRLGESVEYVVLTKWRDMEAIKAFAGETPERAVVEPGAVAALVEFDEFVSHFVVIDEAQR